MDSRTAKRIGEECKCVVRYDNKIKLWNFLPEANVVGVSSFNMTAQQVEKMTPDQLRRKLGAKPAKAKAKPKKERKPNGAFDPEAKITLLVKENPKRQGSKARATYGLYRDGMTVAEFEGAGGDSGSLRWDIEHKYIAVG